MSHLSSRECVRADRQKNPITGLDRPCVFQEVEAHEGGRVVSPTHRPPLPPKNITFNFRDGFQSVPFSENRILRRHYESALLQIYATVAMDTNAMCKY